MCSWLRRAVAVDCLQHERLSDRPVQRLFAPGPGLVSDPESGSERRSGIIDELNEEPREHLSGSSR